MTFVIDVFCKLGISLFKLGMEISDENTNTDQKNTNPLSFKSDDY